MIPTSLTVPIVNTQKWGRRHQVFYACLGLWLLAIPLNLVFFQSILGWQFLVVTLVVLLVVKQFIGDPYTITGYLKLEPWQLTAEWTDDSFMVFSMQDLEQISVLIEAAEDDQGFTGRDDRNITRNYVRSGLTNVLEFYENGKQYRFQFRLRDEDMDALNACLLFWVRGQYDVRIDDYSGRAIPHRVE
ncbi:hypothetical protein [Chitinophaga parva]|nr:hypothetical protein [Chitinophaga parva]